MGVDERVVSSMLTPNPVKRLRDSRVDDSVVMALELLALGEVANTVQAIMRAVNYHYSHDWGEMQWAAVERKVTAATQFEA